MKKYKLDDVKYASMPMALNIKLDLDSSGRSVLEKVYRAMIDLLLYLIASGTKMKGRIPPSAM